MKWKNYERLFPSTKRQENYLVQKSPGCLEPGSKKGPQKFQNRQEEERSLQACREVETGHK